PLAQHHDHDGDHDGDHAVHGEVNFATSCAAGPQAHFDTGLALMHHMMYEQAEASFAEATEADPTCAMAHWGVAMSVIHPLWGERPSDDALRKGTAALERARALEPPTERERAYLDAVEPFFREWEN